MEPVALLALDDEFTWISKIVSPWRILSSLRDYIDHQVPGSGLAYLCQRARDGLFSFVIRRSSNSMQRGSPHSGQPGNIGSGQGGVFVVS